MLGTVAVGNKTVGKEQAGWKLGQVYRREISFVTATEGKRWGALETSVGGGKKLELNKEREELRVIKEEQEKKKKNSCSTILALRAAPDPGEGGRHEKVPDEEVKDNGYTNEPHMASVKLAIRQKNEKKPVWPPALRTKAFLICLPGFTKARFAVA